MRKVPAMSTCFDNMNTCHISYATGSYIRGRRYMPHRSGLKGSVLKPDYYPKGLFATGVKYRITVVKTERQLFMRIENSDQVCDCRMINASLPVITDGRIGLRHMSTRSARYQNFRVRTPVVSSEHGSGSLPIRKEESERKRGLNQK